MNLRPMLIVLACLLLLTVPALAQDDTETTADFNTLIAAIDAADLTGVLAEGGPYTIFAPTDDAFTTTLDALGLTLDELVADSQALNDILLYHVVDGELLEGDIIAAVEAAGGTLEVETLGGELLTVELENEIPLINGTTSVFLPDVSASNGVIHVVQDVLVPPSIAGAAAGANAAAGTIVDVAAAEPQLSTLVAAVEAAGLVETLNSEGPLTVFAPTDAAFEAALTDLGLTAEELLADTDTLTAMLSFHVLDIETTRDDFVELLLEFEEGIDLDTLGGDVWSAQLVESQLILNDQPVEIVIPDLIAANGIVHVIDTVLVPPSLGS